MNIRMSKVPSELHNSTWLANEACDYIENHLDRKSHYLCLLVFRIPIMTLYRPEI